MRLLNGMNKCMNFHKQLFEIKPAIKGLCGWGHNVANSVSRIVMGSMTRIESQASPKNQVEQNASSSCSSNMYHLEYSRLLVLLWRTSYLYYTSYGVDGALHTYTISTIVPAVSYQRNRARKHYYCVAIEDCISCLSSSRGRTTHSLMFFESDCWLVSWLYQGRVVNNPNTQKVCTG